MTPPINIDGTDITGATIDGTDVSEVTVDGTQVFSAIPDTVASRPQDDVTNTNSTGNHGLWINTSQQWPDIQARISANTNTASDEEMVIEDNNGNDIAVVDVSGNSALDVITFSGVNLAANSTFAVYLRATNARDRGFFDLRNSSKSFPFTSSDGNLSITDGYFNGNKKTDFAYGITEIGNINL